jgi:predicted dithiol-disulfide oxidoreductase (DUF899 family)
VALSRNNPAEQFGDHGEIALWGAERRRCGTRTKYWAGSGKSIRHINPDGFSVFTRHNETIRHFYSGEMSGEMADPGQDPRGAPDLDPLWSLLDLTPEGHDPDWYPKLDDGHKD